MRKADRKNIGTIRVEMGCVHISNEGDETYEPFFVDDWGKSGRYLVIGQDGSMSVLDDSGEEEPASLPPAAPASRH